MKKDKFLSLGMLAFVLTLGLVPAGRAGAQQAGGAQQNNEEKTIVITGFELEKSWPNWAGKTPIMGILFPKSLNGNYDWNTQVAYCMVDSSNFKDGTITLSLWDRSKEVGGKGVRWTGTGEYILCLDIKPANTGKSAARFIKIDGKGNVENVVIKEAVTTFKWSEFDFMFDW